jgi:hypothetical protein
MTVDTEQAFFQRQGIGWLWFGLLAPPLAFLLNLQLSYILVRQACVSGHHSVLHLVPSGAGLSTCANLLIIKEIFTYSQIRYHCHFSDELLRPFKSA